MYIMHADIVSITEITAIANGLVTMHAHELYICLYWIVCFD